jgi:UDP-4-amino-4,6-dideoxy-N-acetyl-beta-L-altrosamine transaminase
MIPYGCQSISEEDIQTVVEVLRSDFLTQGPVVPQFEEAICNYTGAKYAVAVNSGTSALHLACRALDLGPGDVLWTSPITFVASANCALYCGAEVDFVDIDPQTYNICTEALTQKLKQAKAAGRLPKVVVPVHMCGSPCDMATIAALAKEYGFHLIEDACHAIGGRYQGQAIGSCQYSDITVFSFHPVKTMTTGEGGMATTNNAQLADKMRLLRSHGITRDAEKMDRVPDGPWYYQQIDLGFNYRMTDMQAALGMSQLTRLDEFVARRNEIAVRYDEKLSALPLRSQYRPEGQRSAMHLYAIRLYNKRIGKTRLQLFAELNDKGIGVNVHYIPVHLQPWYRDKGFKVGDYPQAEAYYADAISLPMFPGLSESDQDYVIHTLSAALVDQ